MGVGQATLMQREELWMLLQQLSLFQALEVESRC